MTDKSQKWDAAFRKFQQENPGATFGHYYALRVGKKLQVGKVHPTLGNKIAPRKSGEVDFAVAGRKRFKYFRRAVGLKPHHRVIDYGCGSLRVGLHLMNYLEPGHYFGLDVTTDFIEVGKDLIGAPLAERHPHLAAIGPESLAQAEAFGADFVFCNAVAMHVHPDERSFFYGNLRRLTGKPGVVLYLNVRLSQSPEQYRHQCWSWPLSEYLVALPDLKFEGQRGKGILLFRRTA